MEGAVCGSVTENPGKSEEGLYRLIGCVKAHNLSAYTALLEEQESWKNGSLDKRTKGLSRGALN